MSVLSPELHHGHEFLLSPVDEDVEEGRRVDLMRNISHRLWYLNIGSPVDHAVWGGLRGVALLVEVCV